MNLFNKNIIILLFGAFVFSQFFLLPGICYSQETTNNFCIECHADYWEGMKNSIHRQENITCDMCHGGNPSKQDMEKVKSSLPKFIAIPTKIQIAEICGGCHSNVVAMNFYNIPTDQLALYRTSAHGKDLFNNKDNNVAVCSDCHAYHDVVAVTDPVSPVYPLNLPDTCNKCHGNKKLMQKYGHPSNIYELYKNSVHGKALFEKHDLGVANCASCHGSHGAIPPGVKEIGKTCGKCHINEEAQFLESPHVKAEERGEFSECISCHGYHDISHADQGLYDVVCAYCHEAGSDAFKRGRDIVHMLQESEEAFNSASALVKQASIEGIFVEEEQAALERAKTSLIQAAPIQHSLSEVKVLEANQKIISITEKVKESIQKKRKDLKWRKFFLIPLWIFIIMMICALWIKYKNLKKRDNI